jgi:hypothetical protein
VCGQRCAEKKRLLITEYAEHAEGNDLKENPSL